MFNLFKKKSTTKVGTAAAFTIEGMHCSSCAMNIDGALEDTDGIISASTSYARAKIQVEYDPLKIDLKKIAKVIQDQGYSATKADE